MSFMISAETNSVCAPPLADDALALLGVGVTTVARRRAM
jgi:hypothetical protein